jgi:hypothetical protein
MRALLIGVVLAATVLPAPAAFAATIDAGVRVNGSVKERDTSAVLDSFSVDSRDTGLRDVSGDADDPGGSAHSDADASYTTAAIVGGERLTADGSASARAGLPVRESDSTSNLTAELTLTEPATYSVSGTLSANGPAGQCCAGATATLRNDDGDKVFTSTVSVGQAPKTLSGGGALTPGDYTLSVEASAGFGFGAAASDISGSGSFDVTFQLSLPDADTDGDALPDDWETQGVDADGDGDVDLDLAAMGADPRHKDLFVELDVMPPHRPALAASALIADAFADAPVGNPDGTPGIALHLDNGPDSVMNPKTGATWGSLSRQSALVHQNVLGTIAGNDYDWSAFDDLKAVAFPAERRSVFRYAISAHGHDGRVSGVARGIPGSDLLMTLGAGCANLNGGVDCTLDPQAQAGTLMHELGHTLGLRHGGGDDLLNKPNHLSVMNYSFQLTGLQDVSGNRTLDYSRFEIPFDERALSETQGFGITAVPPADLMTAGRCPNGSRVAWPIKAGPVDFTCDGAFAAVSADVNGDGVQTALPGFLEWPAVAFAGGSVGGSGAALPDTTPRTEPAIDELVAAKAALDAALPVAPVPGGGTAGAGGGGGTPAGTPEPAAVPALSALAVRPGTFRARRGARVAFTLSSAARVRFTVERLVPGRRRGGRCRAGGRGPRCLRAVRIGAFARDGRPGANSVRLPARIGSRRLKPGRYRLTAAPDGGVRRRAEFRVR